MISTKLAIENRIRLLSGRSGKENAKIIKKLQRQLYKLDIKNK
jgi:hypothetical protein